MKRSPCHTPETLLTASATEADQQAMYKVRVTSVEFAERATHRLCIDDDIGGRACNNNVPT